MKDKINSLISKYKGDIAVAIRNLKTGATTGINDKNIFPSASTIKLVIISSLMNEVNNGKMNLEDKMILSCKCNGDGILKELNEGHSFTLKEIATLMIIQSDNTATNMLIDLLTMEKINEMARELNLRNTQLQRKMMDFEAVNMGKENLTSAEDMCNILEQIYSGKVVNEKYSKIILDILKKQQLGGRLDLYLPRDVVVAHKSGDLERLEHDVGIVYKENCHYIICVLTKNVETNKEGREIIGEISSKVYENIYSNSPELKEDMLSANYWIKPNEMTKVIMNSQEIDAYNNRSIKTVAPIVDLENYKESFSKQEVIDYINTLSSPSKFERFHEDGKLVTKEYYDELMRNCNVEGLMDLNNIKYGITIKRTDMRMYPTYDRVFKTGDSYEFDMFQETAVYPVEPLVILHTSKDGNWYFTHMYNYLAWIPEKDVALARKEELFDYLKTEDFIVTTGKRVFTNYNPLNEQLSEIKFDMGIRIPLVSVKDIEEDIYGQSPTGNYVVKLPTRNSRGKVEFKSAIIARSEEISLGYLPYTRENIIVHGFKFLGERYGWGGTFNSRDCTSFLMDIYRTMGIKLPRNSEEQGELALGNFYEMPENMTIAHREKVLDNLKSGTPLYIKGHAMLYLGKEGGKYYAIHDFSGYYNKENDGSLKYYKSRQVMVAALGIGLSENGKTFTEGLYGARDIILK